MEIITEKNFSAESTISPSLNILKYEIKQVKIHPFQDKLGFEPRVTNLEVTYL